MKSATPEFCFTSPTYRVREVKVITVRDIAAEQDQRVTIKTEAQAATFFNEVVTKSEWYDPEKECFVVLLLDRKNMIKGFNMISLGTLNAALVHPREVLRACLVANATAFVCVHNHPSGDPAPSAADLAVTRQLREAARVVDIDLLDHVIIGTAGADPAGRGFYSFRAAGLL